MPKGFKHSEEAKRQISLSRKLTKGIRTNTGRTHFKEGHKPTFTWKGKKLSEEHKKNISKNHASKKEGYKPWNYIDGRSKFVGPLRYGDDWDKIRLLVYIRDNFTCQKCKIKGIRLDVHHKIPFLLSLNNSLTNLISLCRPCHMREEARIIREMKLCKEVNKQNAFTC